mmetsp:Transcript_63690/g.106244  ORF Transcript_63690/g.106244 Transcript_63690/m.106244 type:complete len:208 (+) Transcript_63690:1066-1689(+)
MTGEEPALCKGLPHKCPGLGDPLRLRAGQVRQHCVGIGHHKRVHGGVVPELGLFEDLHDLPVVDQHRVAPGAHAKALVGLVHEHSHPPREFPVPIGQQHDIFGPDVLPPLVHHKGVVDGEADDVGDAFGLELVVEDLVARQVVGGAGRGEGPGQGKQDDLLAAEDLLRGPVLPAERVWAGHGRIAHAGLEHNIGHASDWAGGLSVLS